MDGLTLRRHRKYEHRLNMLKQRVFLGLVTLAVVGLGVSFATAEADSGTASATLTLIVPVKTVVSCASPSVTAEVGTNALTVTCSISGNPNSLASGTANAFGPGAVTLTGSGGNTLTANLQSNVTSPDGTVSTITGTSAGFSGSISTLPAKVQAVYNVETTNTTKSGTYTGATTYTWSTI